MDCIGSRGLKWKRPRISDSQRDRQKGQRRENLRLCQKELLQQPE